MPTDPSSLARYGADELQTFAAELFQHFNVPAVDARRAAEILVLADLRGFDSHGVARLTAYCGLLSAGRLNPRPRITIVRETPGTATVDGDNGLGLVVAPHANEIALDKADQVGTGWVAVRNTNHYGIAGWYVLEALKRDQIGWSMTNTSRITAPLWGAERMLGTNPIAIAFPGLEEPPIVIDMATTAAAFGKIEMAIRRNQPIPAGWRSMRTVTPRPIRTGWSMAVRCCRSDRTGCTAATRGIAWRR
jgi:LDH2 family malate/lactate/ureidoglycolate dehydrogenase